MLSVQDGLTEPHQEVQYRSNLCSEAQDGEESSWNDGQEIHGHAPQETETQKRLAPRSREDALIHQDIYSA